MESQLIVALDVPDRASALEVTRTLGEEIRFFKVGLELFTAEGPDLVREITSGGHEVFLDLKLHDIPNTVAGAVRSATRVGAFLVTLHTLGGMEMMRAAGEAARSEAERIGAVPPRLVGVTVLTSQREDVVGPGEGLGAMVLDLARKAKEAGLPGVVASVEECSRVKDACGGEFLVVTPGIRPSGAGDDDQKRVATPEGAVTAGSDFLVVGRPILNAPDPLVAARMILEEMHGVGR